MTVVFIFILACATVHEHMKLTTCICDLCVDVVVQERTHFIRCFSGLTFMIHIETSIIASDVVKSTNTHPQLTVVEHLLYRNVGQGKILHVVY